MTATELWPDPPEERRIAGLLTHGRKENRAVDRLCRFADTRTLAGPVLDKDRDLLLDGMEELADLKNYATWAARRGLITERAAAQVCAHAAEAFRILEGART